MTFIVGHTENPTIRYDVVAMDLKPVDSNGLLYQVAVNFHSPLQRWAIPPQWESPGPEIQSVFEATSRKWIDVHGQRWDLGDQEGLAYATSLGNKKTARSLFGSRGFFKVRWRLLE